jgi:hypothetical protein
MTLPKAYSKYGADMGRRSDPFPADLTGTVKALELSLDGDYDSGGAYWGSTEGTSIWRLTAETDEEVLVAYHRVRSFAELSEKLKNECPQTTLVKEGVSLDRMEQFALHYMLTALWSSTTDDDQPMDEAGLDVADETLDKFRVDCTAFLMQADVIAPDEDDSNLAHDFWLTRNGHGAGFWDGDYEEEIGEKLTKLAKTFPEVNLYVGDDGKVYQS